MSDEIETRIGGGGVQEHRHVGYEYWHPANIVHREKGVCTDCGIKIDFSLDCCIKCSDKKSAKEGEEREKQRLEKFFQEEPNPSGGFNPVFVNDKGWVLVDLTVDEVIGKKMDHQGRQSFKLDTLTIFKDGKRSQGVIVISSDITKKELEYINSRPESRYSGSKVSNSSVWVHFDEKDKKVYRGSGCGVSVSGVLESLSGLSSS